MVDMQPQPGDTTVQLPMTFDYKGGRGGQTKGKLALVLIAVLLVVLGEMVVWKSGKFELWQECVFGVAVFYVGLFIIRFPVFREQYFSDVYEEMKESDNEFKLDYYWQIFDIATEYPYICYFKNGYKGVFVRMERDAITGKTDSNIFDHYEAIGDAYNLCHSLNMNMIHIDYMDNVGNDPRMEELYNELAFVENPDMQQMMIDIYSNLSEEMSRVYSCFDVYLFLSRDVASNLIYNIQSVANAMLSGNYITFKVLDRYEIAGVCTSLFNMHDFSILDACHDTMTTDQSSGIVPIKVTHSDGTVDIINKTSEEKRIESEVKKRQAADKEREALENRHKARHEKQARKRGKNATTEEQVDENIDLFGDMSSSSESSEDSNDFNLF